MLLNLTPTAGAANAEGRTRTVSVRLTDAEHARIRQVAQRLGASEAAVIRYAIRSMLTRLAPLYDAQAQGFSLLPVFVECGAELASYFDLDVERLDRIINGTGAEHRSRVELDDLVLLAMAGLGEPRVHAKLRELGADAPSESGDVPNALRSYFYAKYIYGTPEKARD